MGHHKEIIDITQEPRRIDNIDATPAGKAWVVGVACLLLALGLSFLPVHGGGMDHALAQFFRSYILAFCFILSIALGALLFVMIHHVSRAGWSVTVRRIAECIAGQLPMIALLAIPILIPILFSMEHVYPWSDAHVVESDPTGLLQKKTAYLNKPFFIIRLAIYFIVWSWLGGFFLNKSTEQDLTGDDSLTLRMQALSAPGILIFALTATFFSFDVLMSLVPHWFSTMFGVYFFAGCMVSFFASMVLAMVLVQRSGRVPHAITQEHYHDIGKWLFAFIVFWTYIAYSQYMLYWYANIPEETMWYLPRQATPYWVGVSVVLLFGHFIIPFLALISRFPKRHPNLLLLGAVWMLGMHFVDMHYLVAPDVEGYHMEGHEMRPGWAHLLTDIPLTLGLAAILFYWVAREIGRHSLVPERDPRLAESQAFENF
ncbi:MAG: quinol:cytochrome C oxidoreductase [Phycisphaerae bacterium]